MIGKYRGNKSCMAWGNYRRNREQGGDECDYTINCMHENVTINSVVCNQYVI